MNPVNVTAENFEAEVMRSDRPVLMDFWAGWCGPCKALSPVIDDIAREHPEIKVCKVNIDEQPALTGRYNVMSVPSLLAIKDGQIIARTAGVQPKQQILALFE